MGLRSAARDNRRAAEAARSAGLWVPAVFPAGVAAECALREPLAGTSYPHRHRLRELADASGLYEGLARQELLDLREAVADLNAYWWNTLRYDSEEDVVARLQGNGTRLPTPMGRMKVRDVSDLPFWCDAALRCADVILEKRGI